VNGSQDGSGAAHLNRAHASLPHRPSAAGSTQPGVGTVLYARASLDRSGRQSSVTTQDRKYKLLCEQNEWRSIGRFVDNDVSASKREVQRAEFERMLGRIATGRLRPDLIVANDVSRLLRNRRDKIRLEELIEDGVNIYDMRYGFDTRASVGRILFGFLAEMAIDRAEELAQYQRDFHDRRRAEGKPSKGAQGTGHVAVYGADGKVSHFVIDETTAPGIRWAVAQLRTGASLRSVAIAWNDPSDPHYVKRTKGVWHDATIRKIVASARIAGCVELPAYGHDGGVVSVALVPNKDGTLPAIVDVAHRRARTRTRRSRRATPPTAPRRVGCPRIARNARHDYRASSRPGIRRTRSRTRPPAPRCGPTRCDTRLSPRPTTPRGGTDP